MVKAINSISSYLVYNENDENYYKVEIEVDHQDFDQEYYTIFDKNNIEVENEELSEEIINIFDEWNGTYLIDEDE